jgi:hypothetical protein
VRWAENLTIVNFEHVRPLNHQTINILRFFIGNAILSPSRAVEARHMAGDRGRRTASGSAELIRKPSNRT